MDLKDLVDRYPGYFIVNYENFEVIYTEGYENEYGLYCYRVSDLEKKQNEDTIEASAQEVNSEETQEAQETEAEGAETEEGKEE